VGEENPVNPDAVTVKVPAAEYVCASELSVVPSPQFTVREVTPKSGNSMIVPDPGIEKIHISEVAIFIYGGFNNVAVVTIKYHIKINGWRNRRT
jgi:hypothetical protein